MLSTYSIQTVVVRYLTDAKMENYIFIRVRHRLIPVIAAVMEFGKNCCSAVKIAVNC